MSDNQRDEKLAFDEAEIKKMLAQKDSVKQKENIEKLFEECKRLSLVAEDKNKVINQKQQEYEKFKKEYKNGGADDVKELDVLRQELNANQAEI